MQTLGERVRWARLRVRINGKPMTQTQLAQRVKTHKNTISDLERDRFHPGLEMGLRLSEGLGVNLRWLVGQTDNHRRGIQLETDQEEANYLAYRKMTAAERQQFADFMADFLRHHPAGRKTPSNVT